MRRITKKLIEKFERYLAEEEKSAATSEKYMRDIRKFKKWIEKKDIDKPAVLEYKRFLEDNYAPSSVNSMLSSINSFFEFNEWYCCKVKTLKIQKRTFAEDERELTRSEYERLLKAAKNNENKRLYYLMQTICSTGIRVSELKFITVEAVQTKQAVINCKGKIRVILLQNSLCKILSQYIKERNIKKGSVFQTRSGRPLNRTNIWADMKKLCKMSGVSEKKVFPHNLRHLFARTYYSLQKDIVRLADILGHSNINTTRIYTMESGSVHRKHMQKIGHILLKT